MTKRDFEAEIKAADKAQDYAAVERISAERDAYAADTCQNCGNHKAGLGDLLNAVRYCETCDDELRNGRTTEAGEVVREANAEYPDAVKAAEFHAELVARGMPAKEA